MTSHARFAFALLAGLALLPGAGAEEVKGPVHLEGNQGRADHAEGIREAREDLADAREQLADAGEDLDAVRKELGRVEAGDFSDIVTIVDGQPIKCGDPGRYPGCVPYTAEEKARMVEEMRRDLAQAERDLAQARRDLDQAERELALAEAGR